MIEGAPEVPVLFAGTLPVYPVSQAPPSGPPAVAYLPMPAAGTYPGGTTEFLRADQTWDTPPGGGGGGGGGDQ